MYNSIKYDVLDKKKNIIYTAIFLCGVVFLCFDFYLIAVTIINYRVPFLIGSIVTILVSYFDFENYNSTYKFPDKYSKYFFSFGQNLISWGSLTVFIFVGSNYYFEKKEFKEKEFEIIERYESYGGKGNRSREDVSLYINHKSDKEDIHFNGINHSEIDKIKSITLDVREGFFGYLIYRNKRINWKD